MTVSVRSEDVELFRGISENEVAVVVPHPDDETIGFSVPLGLFPKALMVHVTDGAPMDNREWKDCATRNEYALLRQREAREALDIVGHTGPRHCLGIADTTAMSYIVEIVTKLRVLFAENGTSVVFTHACEGGHPDHDATAFALHMIARLQRPLQIIEAPFYRMGREGSVWQRFIPSSETEEIVVMLNDEEREIKRRMLSAYVSQAEACSKASLTTEYLREAPAYDFSRLPNNGKLSRNYTRAGIGAENWSVIAKAVLEAFA